eukprot:COSAG06_NODE_6413_length_2944_cov_2.117047_1_plen_124_part_10
MQLYGLGVIICRLHTLKVVHKPPLAQHSLPRDRDLRQSDRPWAPDDGKRDLPQLRALDPMPVLGDVGVVSSILNCMVKLASATSTTDKNEQTGGTEADRMRSHAGGCSILYLLEGFGYAGCTVS